MGRIGDRRMTFYNRIEHPVYFNDFDEGACAWIAELMKQGHIPPGEIDRRSILEVTPDDVKPFKQVHMFAGIAGWAYALRLAGVPVDISLWTGSPPCFPKDVLVTTKRGIIPINEVIVGDECLTHLGNWKPVVRVGSAVKDVVMLSGQGHFGLVTTANHPFWARSRVIQGTRENGMPIRKHKVLDAHWRDASEMENHWWSMPSNFGEIKPPSIPGYNDRELAILAGLYVGDGWIGKGREHGSLILGVNDAKASEIERLLPRISFKRHAARTGVRLIVNDKTLGRFLAENFGEQSLSKTLPLWLLMSYADFKDAFVSGWDLTDGTRVAHSGVRRITTASRKLAIIGRMLLVSMGYSVSIRKVETLPLTVIENRIVNQADYYTINRSNCDRYKFTDERHTWFKVKSVCNPGKMETVFDIEVADDHSYVADGIVVHNCQPFSVAGPQKGRDDERHLAPHFVDLVRAARPGMLLGEQVASAKVFGKAPKRVRGNAVPPPDWAWLDDLSDRLEAARYAVGANDFPSAGVGAPHIRQRTYFGAVAHEWLEHASRNGRIEWGAEPSQRGTSVRCGTRGLADLHGNGCSETGRGQPEAGCDGPFGDSAARGLGDCLGSGLEGLGWNGDGSREPGRIVSGALGSASEAGTVGEGRPGPTNGFWGTADWLFCRDERFRPVEPGTFPLATRVSGRVGLLRGYGNAINCQQAAIFIQAFFEALENTVRNESESLLDSGSDGLIV